MKCAELKEILRTIPDDVEIDFQLQVDVPKEELERRSWKWPWDYEPLQFDGFDCGYSDRTLKLYLGKRKGWCKE